MIGGGLLVRSVVALRVVHLLDLAGEIVEHEDVLVDEELVVPEAGGRFNSIKRDHKKAQIKVKRSPFEENTCMKCCMLY